MNKKNSDRDVAIAQAVAASACSLRTIGDSYGLSAARVSQIAAKQGIARQSGRQPRQDDRDDLLRECPQCGNAFSAYAHPRRRYCSRRCSRLAHSTPAEVLWDGWCLWLRLGGVFPAGALAGINGASLAKYLRRWGISLGQGHRAKKSTPRSSAAYKNRRAI